jgi:apolipoprotein N-acyltransferase
VCYTAAVLVRSGLAALSGLLTFAAFPGVGAWPLAFVAWVPLLLALAGVTARRAAALGLIAGFFAALPGLRFLYPVLRVESGFGPAVCGLIVLAAALYHALRGLVIGVVSRAWSAGAEPPSLSFVAGLAASELAVPSLFPWYFGASVHDVPLLLQPAELLGPVAVSVVLALSSVAVAETIAAMRDGHGTRPRVIVTAIAVPIVAAFWGSVRIPAIDAKGRASPAITAGVVQPNIARGGEIEILQHHREATRELVSNGAGLVVWAEGALPWTVPARLAKDIFPMLGVPDVPLLTGAIVQDPPPSGAAGADPEVSTRLANSALLFDGGRLTGRYDKHLLLPFSERLPLESVVPSLRAASPRSGNFTPGKSYSPVYLHGHGVAVFICYEDLFPGHVRALARGGDVELLVNLTNDSWFSGTDEPRVHLALAKLRAVEQRKHLVRATLTGKSAIVDPAGRLLAAVPEDRAGTLLTEVHWMQGTTLYNLVGDAPWWALVAGVLLLSYRRRPRPADAR